MVDRSGSRWFQPVANPRRPGIHSYIDSKNVGMQCPPQNEKVRQELLEYLADNNIAPRHPPQRHAPKSKIRSSSSSTALPQLNSAQFGPRRTVVHFENSPTPEIKASASLPALVAAGPPGNMQRYMPAAPAAQAPPAIQQLELPHYAPLESGARRRTRIESEESLAKKESKARRRRVDSRSCENVSDAELDQKASILRDRTLTHRQSFRAQEEIQVGPGWSSQLVHLQSHHNRAMRSNKPSMLRLTAAEQELTEKQTKAKRKASDFGAEAETPNTSPQGRGRQPSATLFRADNAAESMRSLKDILQPKMDEKAAKVVGMEWLKARDNGDGVERKGIATKQIVLADDKFTKGLAGFAEQFASVKRKTEVSFEGFGDVSP